MIHPSRTPSLASGTSLLLDWDGCLVNSLPFWRMAVVETLADLNIRATDTELATALHRWGTLTDLGVPDLAEFSQALYGHFRAHLPDIQLNPGALMALTELQAAGVKMAIVTSSPMAKVVPVLERFALEPFFDTLVTKDSVSQLKPHPEPLYQAMQQLNSRADRTYMMGDGRVDVLAGNQAGVTSLWYHPQHNHEFHSDRGETAALPQHEVIHWDALLPLMHQLQNPPLSGSMPKRQPESVASAVAGRGRKF